MYMYIYVRSYIGLYIYMCMCAIHLYRMHPHRVACMPMHACFHVGEVLSTLSCQHNSV